MVLASQLQNRTSAQTNTLPTPPSGYIWTTNTALTDEFKLAQLDQSKWTPANPRWQGRVPSHYDIQNVTLTGGTLALRSSSSITNLAQLNNPTNDVWIGAACISSKLPLASYGYYEARVKASKMSMTSSFWLQGAYSEIDVAELMGAAVNDPTLNTYMPINTHYFPNGWATDKSTPLNIKMATGVADGYNTYAVWWKDQTNIWYYLNGSNVAKVVTSAPFAEPMYLYLDTECFTWEGFPTFSSMKQAPTNTMYVDFVRAWTLVHQ